MDAIDTMLAATYRRLGEAATWYPLTGAVASVTVIPDMDPAGEGFGDVGVTTQARYLRVRATELSAPTPEKGDRVEWNDVRWKVSRVRTADARGREWACTVEKDC